MPSPDDFPADADGDALRRLLATGDDLTRPRPIEFTFVFARPEDALAFSDRIQALGLSTPDISGTEVIVNVNMVPIYADIVATTARLSSWAAESGGRNDGWGCFSAGTSAPS